MGLPSNTRLNCAGPIKKKDSVLTRTSAGLHTATTNLSPDKLIRLRRRSAMASGIKDAVVMVGDASLDTKKSDGKIRHAYWVYRLIACRGKHKSSILN